MTTTHERLHPESWRELRQLYKLHGGPALLRALNQIIDEDTNQLVNKCIAEGNVLKFPVPVVDVIATALALPTFEEQMEALEVHARANDAVIDDPRIMAWVVEHQQEIHDFLRAARGASNP